MENFPWVLLAQELIQETQITGHPRDQVAAIPTLLTTPYLATQDWVVKVAVAVIVRSYPPHNSLMEKGVAHSYRLRFRLFDHRVQVAVFLTDCSLSYRLGCRLLFLFFSHPLTVEGWSAVL
jgi:hypothetical protein